jgi:hypothetical protein
MDEASGVKVRIRDFVDALEMQSDEFLSFVDLDSGRVESVTRDLLSMAEEYDDDEEPDLPAWQVREWKLVRKIAFSNRFKRIPTKFDVHEWAIMEEFSNAVESERIREELLDAIDGAGAFRNFKAALGRRRMERAWFEFRADALRQIAIDWCERRHIPWE